MVPLQCLWCDSVTLISTLLLTYVLTTVVSAYHGITCLLVAVSPEAKVKLQERRVNSLVEESCLASSRGEFKLVCLPVCLFLCLSVCLFVCLILAVCLSASLFVCLPVCPSVCLFVSLPVCLSVLSVSLSACLCVCLSMFVTYVYLCVCVSLYFIPPPLRDVMLVWRKGNINKNCLCATVLYNGAQWYEQFLQLVRLYHALMILLGLALSFKHLFVFSLQGAI